MCVYVYYATTIEPTWIGDFGMKIDYNHTSREFGWIFRDKSKMCVYLVKGI